MAEEKFVGQKLSDEELDGVAGGNAREKNEIISHLSKANPDMMVKVGKIASDEISSGTDSDIAVSVALKRVLHEDYGINSSILDGRLPNKYSGQNGNALSHQEVLNIIDTAGDFVII